MKCSALNVDFNGVRFDLGSRSPPYERIKFAYPLQNVRFLLLSTNLAWEWLQIDTDLLRIITSTAGELFDGTNIHDLERPWTPNIWVLSEFFAILGCNAHLELTQISCLAFVRIATVKNRQKVLNPDQNLESKTIDPDPEPDRYQNLSVWSLVRSSQLRKISSKFVRRIHERWTDEEKETHWMQCVMRTAAS